MGKSHHRPDNYAVADSGQTQPTPKISRKKAFGKGQFFSEPNEVKSQTPPNQQSAKTELSLNFLLDRQRGNSIAYLGFTRGSKEEALLAQRVILEKNKVLKHELAAYAQKFNALMHEFMSIIQFMIEHCIHPSIHYEMLSVDDYQYVVNYLRTHFEKLVKQFQKRAPDDMSSQARDHFYQQMEEKCKTHIHALSPIELLQRHIALNEFCYRKPFIREYLTMQQIRCILSESAKRDILDDTRPLRASTLKELKDKGFDERFDHFRLHEIQKIVTAMPQRVFDLLPQINQAQLTQLRIDNTPPICTRRKYYAASLVALTHLLPNIIAQVRRNKRRQTRFIKQFQTMAHWHRGHFISETTLADNLMDKIETLSLISITEIQKMTLRATVHEQLQTVCAEFEDVATDQSCIEVPKRNGVTVTFYLADWFANSLCNQFLVDSTNPLDIGHFIELLRTKLTAQMATLSDTKQSTLSLS